MKKSFAPLVATALGLAVAVILGEIGTRLVAPAWLQHRMAYLNPATAHATFAGDRDWKVEHTPDGKFLRFAPESSFAMQHLEYNLTARIDAKGGRTIAPVPRSGPVVPFLGDSFTFGVGVADEETFVSLTAVQLQRPLLNLGVPGSTLTDHVRLARARMAELGNPPIWVFCVFCGNDLNDLLARAGGQNTADENSSHRPASPPTGQDAKAARHQGFIWEANRLASTNPWLRRSYLLQLVRNGLLRAINRSGDMPSQDPAFLLMDPAQADLRERLTKLWGEALDELQLLQKEQGFKALFVVIPDRYQVNKSLRALQADYYGLEAQSLEPDWATQTVIAGLAQRNLPYLDLTEALQGKAGFFYVQDNHLTAEGHRKAAESIGPWLGRLLEAAPVPGEAGSD